MIKFENVTNLKDFRNKVKTGLLEYKKDDNGDVIIIYNLYKSMPHIYRLKEIENGMYCFSSENEEYFSVIFRSNSNFIEILEAEKGNKKYKSDRFLKSFMQVLLIPNSFLLLYDLF